MSKKSAQYIARANGALDASLSTGPAHVTAVVVASAQVLATLALVEAIREANAPEPTRRMEYLMFRAYHADMQTWIALRAAEGFTISHFSTYIERDDSAEHCAFVCVMERPAPVVTEGEAA